MVNSAIAEAIAQDKELTKKLLDAAGVPVPPGRTAVDADDVLGNRTRNRASCCCETQRW